MNAKVLILNGEKLSVKVRHKEIEKLKTKIVFEAFSHTKIDQNFPYKRIIRKFIDLTECLAIRCGQQGGVEHEHAKSERHHARLHAREAVRFASSRVGTVPPGLVLQRGSSRLLQEDAIDSTSRDHVGQSLQGQTNPRILSSLLRTSK